MSIKDYNDLEVWQDGIRFVTAIYKATKHRLLAAGCRLLAQSDHLLFPASSLQLTASSPKSLLRRLRSFLNSTSGQQPAANSQQP